MISYDRDPQQTIPESSVKIIGLGGAGANILDRATLDGLTGPEMMCVNTDIRTLSSSVAAEKIHLGKNLTKGLGSGGDPDLGARAAEEAETEIRDALRGRKMVFLCVGLGGGTGSGAAPLIVRIAREEGAFVVVFATMPFGFEGQRRKEQAQTSLNELAVLANAVVTFDNDRMGELVLAKQGIHEAFAACDRMISDSIKAVTRLVVRPGLINIGLGELMKALSTIRSRCLFGSGVGHGESRSQQAIENALNSPLLDKGQLLSQASSVLIHICGDESLTLYEVELLMQNLSKHIPEDAQVLFGVATDPSMEGALSVTLISAVPEERLHGSAEEDHQADLAEKSSEDELGLSVAVPAVESATVIDTPEDEQIMEPSEGYSPEEDFADPFAGQADDDTPADEDVYGDDDVSADEDTRSEDPAEEQDTGEDEQDDEGHEQDYDDFVPLDDVQSIADAVLQGEEIDIAAAESSEPDGDEDEQPFAEIGDEGQEDGEQDLYEESETVSGESFVFEIDEGDDARAAQAELELDGGPKGKFQGESPNLLEGEDLDIPPFLRNKRR